MLFCCYLPYAANHVVCSMTYTVRRATVADASLIAAISRQTFHDTFAVNNTEADMQKFMDGPFRTDVLMKEVEQSSFIFLLAYAGESVAGYAKLAETENPEGVTGNAMEICRIYNTREFIGKGVGAFLMNYIIDLCRSMGKQELWLGVWEHNERAKSFYAKFGFTHFGSHDFILGDDVQTDWLMKKTIL